MITRLIDNVIIIEIQIEAILSGFFEDCAKLFLNYVYKAYEDYENKGRGKIIRSIKNRKKLNYRKIS